MTEKSSSESQHLVEKGYVWEESGFLTLEEGGGNRCSVAR